VADEPIDLDDLKAWLLRHYEYEASPLGLKYSDQQIADAIDELRASEKADHEAMLDAYYEDRVVEDSHGIEP
jgi:hypothetical protein